MAESRVELRRLAVAVNRAVEDLVWTVTRRVVAELQVPAALVALGTVDGIHKLAERCARGAMHEVASAVGEKEAELQRVNAALGRSVADADELGERARRHWAAADRLRGELVVALQQLEQARGELHRLREQLTCPSEFCDYVGSDLVDLLGHETACHPAASPSDPGGGL